MADSFQTPLNTSLPSRATAIHIPKPTRVKNKVPAQIQITAEQIVREAKELQEEEYRAPKQKITDPEELAEYQLKKRKEFEDLIRRVRWNGAVWVKYAVWEEQQGDLPRARSVWERALDVSHRNVSVWLKYAEMEMRHKQINHARNVWDRAVSILPRIDQLWYKYIHMEEMIGNVAGARQVFERWMQWEPDHQGWAAFVKMELRYNEIDRARGIYERYVQCHPTAKAWMRFAKFEHQVAQDRQRAREVYERAVQTLEGEPGVEEIYLKFAKFEEACKEPERARAIYKFALDNVPKAEAEELYREFVIFEKQHGNREGIEDVVVSKARFQYEDALRANPRDYDSWFDYIRLEESTGDVARTREVYERAIAQLPPAPEKRYWQRYIYLWIKYALFEELETGDAEKARDVYTEALKLVPHKVFTFGKLWILAAKFEIRQLELGRARKLLGQAIGMAPKTKVFDFYIDTELQLGNVDRCRALYERFLEWAPHNCGAWIKFAELERSLGETDRARAIFELAISQPLLDMPEKLWKTFIDAEIADGERERARALYERLLNRTKHVKVWLSYARFEAAPLPTPEAEGAEAPEDDPPETRNRAARSVFERAHQSLKEGNPDAKEERVMLLEAWRQFEVEAGSGQQAVAAVEKKLPRRVKKRRQLFAADGAPAGQEEYFDYIFPDEEGAAPSLKILQAAYAWKAKMALAQAQGGGDGEGAGAGGKGDGGGDVGGAGGEEEEDDETRRYREGGSDDEDRD